MSRLMQVRLVFAVIGIVVWGYAVAADNARLRLVGIVLLALSLVLRFFTRRNPPAANDEPAS
jgi:hypothetical protein